MPSLSGRAEHDARVRARLRAAADRSAGAYRDHAAVPDVITERLLERLEFVRLDPRRVLDASSALGPSAAALRIAYRKAEILAMDVSAARAAALRRSLPRFRARCRPLVAALDALPLPDACCDLVFSALALPLSATPDAGLAEVARVLRPGGVAMFASLGPRTFEQLRVWGDDAAAHVHDFPDMHDLGDAMLRVGLADVVVESEVLDVTYPDVSALRRELRALGVINVHPRRRRSLTGKGRGSKLRQSLGGARGDDRVPLSIEVAYAHAFVVERSSAAGPTSARASVEPARIDVAGPARRVRDSERR